MDVMDDLRLGEGQKIVIALEVIGQIGKTRAAKIRLVEL